MEYRPLGKTGLNLSLLGFGAAPLGGVFGEIDEAAGIATVHAAFDAGINYVDVSPYYGITRAEAVLGRALKTVDRDRYILSTKVGRYNSTDFDFSPARVTRSIEESLQRLNVEHIDLIVCHDIEFVNIGQVVQETLPALYNLRDQGKVRFVGVSGLPLAIFPRVLDQVPLDFVLSYCHYALNDDTLLGLLPYLEQKEIGIINASPLSMGLLTNGGPQPWHPATEELKAACARAADLCRSRGTDIATLGLQYSLSAPAVASTLSGIASQEQLHQNLACVGVPPEPALLREILELLQPVHNQSWSSGLPENSIYP